MNNKIKEEEFLQLKKESCEIFKIPVFQACEPYLWTEMRFENCLSWPFALKKWPRTETTSLYKYMVSGIIDSPVHVQRAIDHLIFDGYSPHQLFIAHRDQGLPITECYFPFEGKSIGVLAQQLDCYQENLLEGRFLISVCVESLLHLNRVMAILDFEKVKYLSHIPF